MTSHVLFFNIDVVSTNSSLLTLFLFESRRTVTFLKRFTCSLAMFRGWIYLTCHKFEIRISNLNVRKLQAPYKNFVIAGVNESMLSLMP